MGLLVLSEWWLRSSRHSLRSQTKLQLERPFYTVRRIAAAPYEAPTTGDIMPNMMKAYIYEPMNAQIMLEGPPRRGPSIAPMVQRFSPRTMRCRYVRAYGEENIGKRNGKALRHRKEEEAARQRGIERGKATERHLLIRCAHTASAAVLSEVRCEHS